VYWIPIFELLEAAGLMAELVEPRQLKRVPGPLRESDYLRASVSVASEVTQSGLIDRLVPAGCRNARITDLFAPSGRVTSTSGTASFTHAEGVTTYEFAIAPCAFRCDGCDRAQNPAGERGGRTRSAPMGPVA